MEHYHVNHGVPRRRWGDAIEKMRHVLLKILGVVVETERNVSSSTTRHGYVCRPYV